MALAGFALDRFELANFKAFTAAVTLA